MFRLATSILSPGGARGRLSAFIFHRVLPAPDPLQPSEPHAEQFDEMLGWIGSQFNVLPPLEACERLYAKSLPPRAAIITFDDGYRDNHDIALPLLKKHGMTAVFFIATGYLDGGVMFNDRVIEAVRATVSRSIDLQAFGAGRIDLGGMESRRNLIQTVLPRIKYLSPAERLDAVSRFEDACGCRGQGDLMMSSAQVVALASSGAQVGGHTHSHPILRMVDADSARREIAKGRDDVRAIVGTAPRLFAYPNGKFGDDISAEHCALVREAGFDFAFTTHPGVSSPDVDRYRLPRSTPWSRVRTRFEWQAVRNMLPAASAQVGG